MIVLLIDDSFILFFVKWMKYRILFWDIQVNPGAVSFFRTQYPPEMVRGLVQAIKDKSVSPADRFILHADLFALVNHLS